MRFLVIDGNSILNRSFYGVKPLTTAEGFCTNALVGFLNILIKMKEEIKPDGIAVAFDVHAPTFRHKMFDAYKGTRHGTPPELLMQFDPCKEILRALGHTVIECEGYEADDIVGTLSVLCEQTGNECFIATGDRDCLQLITDQVTVRLATTREAIYYTPDRYREQYGIDPIRLIDVKALMGDSSDNIPGVKGIGEKTAFSLIAAEGTLEQVYEHLEDLSVTPRIKKLLVEGRESAEMSKTLATICTAAPIDMVLEHYLDHGVEEEHLVTLLHKYEMNSYVERLHLSSDVAPVPSEPVVSSCTETVVQNPSLERVEEALQKETTLDFLVSLENDVMNRLLITADQTVFDFTFGAEQAFDALVLTSKKPLRTCDAKDLYRFCLRRGTPIKRVAFDVTIAAYLLDAAGKSYEPAALAAQYQIVPPALSDLQLSASVLPHLSDILENRLSAEGMRDLFFDMELPFSVVLADMEVTGFDVDRAGVEQFGIALEEQIKKLRSRMVELAGEEFNPNSTKDLNRILFEKLGLASGKKTKSGYSTNVEALEAIRYQHEIIPTLLEYRKLTKLHSTYVVGLLKVIDPSGRVHSTFNQTETRTGRISSSNPNMQNIPVRTELGREMRRFFRAKEGYVLVDADYSQIELRILAHIADDEQMIGAFVRGEDIHAATASQVFGMPIEQVTSELRSRAKAINFGIVYGIGGYSLSQDIGVSVSQAKAYIDHYLETFSGIDRFMKEAVESAKKTGYVTTMYGRRRYIEELQSSNRNLRNFGERAAMNAPIQGTAADFIKIAMIRVYDRLLMEHLDAKLILQVHDELILEVSEQDAERATRCLTEEMEHVAELKSKLLVSVASGKTWYDAKD